jgi:hypothetical protein
MAAKSRQTRSKTVGRKAKLPGLYVVDNGRKENRRPIVDAATDDDELFTKPPRFLNIEGQKIWMSAVRSLSLIEELSPDHVYGLLQLAYSWQRMVKNMEAEKDIDHKDNECFRKMLVEYGLTPQARQRMDPTGKARYDRGHKKKHTDENPSGNAPQPSDGQANPFEAMAGAAKTLISTQQTEETAS